jgi:glucan phosphoethanolaminetransferase (alkaline phosphatase superfamily)
LKIIKISIGYCFGWFIFLFFLLIFSLLFYGWGEESGILLKILFYSLSLILFLFVVLVVIIMACFLINGRIKYNDEYLLIKNIHRSFPNFFSISYKKIILEEIKDYKYIHEYKHERLKLFLKDGRRYSIGGLIFRNSDWYEFIEKIKNLNE